MTKRWYFYRMSPIDFYWEFLDTVEETVEKLTKFTEDEADPLSYNGLSGFLADWKEAKSVALNGKWEGDFRGSPRVFWIPAEQEFLYAFAWKQDNNGSTFIVSPHALPHLNEHTY
ncbi:TPA: hypothetical protein QCJ76_001744 [Enterobacter asburiae]|nr:hypothetical protein [Enterobacter asburiae]